MTKTHVEEQFTQRLGIVLALKPGLVVQELGWDEDCDSRISEAIEDLIDDELLAEDADELVDVVLCWWRDGDGDLVDGLVDACRNLAPGGKIWLLTPGNGKPGALVTGVIPESAQLAGLVETKAERLGDWRGSCLVAAGQRRGGE